MNDVCSTVSTSAPSDLPVVMKGDEEKTMSPKVGSEQVAQPAGRGGVNDDRVPGTISGR